MYSQFCMLNTLIIICILNLHRTCHKLLFDICCRDTQYALFESFVRKTLDDIRADKKVCFNTRILDLTLRIEDRMCCA